MVDLEAIEQVLEEQIRPHLHAHGGGLRSLSFEDGVYRFQFLGRCSGCPSADLTTEELVAEVLQSALPKVRQVLLIRQVSPDLLDQARALMGRNRAQG